MNKAWIEAMRLRTLPVSCAGVIAGAGCAAGSGSFRTIPFIICLIFALLAQIISNFANEYYDFRKGLDKKGREGFRRGVTEGDISPKAMRNATFALLALNSLIGLSLIYWGGWWMIAVGIAVAIFAIAYSAGPYPLSHHGLGEVAVIIFFGLVPVSFTYYLTSGAWTAYPTLVLPVALAIGLMGANVLIVNNYRDADDDARVNKHTSAVIFGRKKMRRVYFINGIAAVALLALPTILYVSPAWLLFLLFYANQHYLLWAQIGVSEGKELNPLLGKTAMTMFVVSLWVLLMFSL